MLYPRKLLAEIHKHIATKEVVVVTGMRRVGKTTLLRMIFDGLESANKAFLDIENPLEQKVFEETDYNNIWANLAAYGINKNFRAYIFLDEIQAQPQIVKAVKYLHDHWDIKFFVTGSSSFYLKNLFPESLAGRKTIFELYPLDFSEFLIFKREKFSLPKTFRDMDRLKNPVVFEKLKKLYAEYLEFGSFPQVALAENFEQKKEGLEDIFKSYFEKEVQALADFKNINQFRDLLLLLLQRAGSKLEISKLASEVGVTRQTVYSYLAFLENTYFVRFVPMFSKSRDRQVASGKKVYICDTGILSQFGRVSAGAVLENSIFLNLNKYGSINYFQKPGSTEVDFILPDLGVGLEVKQSGNSADYKKLASAAKSLGLKEYYLVTENFTDQKGAIPASYI